jgi:NADP-dependent aldehyde dehydrogenase
MQLHGNNILGGERSHAGKSTLRGVDPACGQPLEPEFYEATESEIDRALELAAAAFEEYCRLPAAAVAAFLEAVAEEILSLGDALLERAARETGLGRERLSGERARTMNQFRAFADVVREGSWVEASIDTAAPDRTPVPKPDLRRKLIPLGPVVVFGASNFPLAYSVAGGDTASALAAGNPVVVKAHPAHPGTSEMTAEAIGRAARKSGMPAGVFSLLHGAAPEISLRLVRHRLTRAVGFTGSQKVGRILFDAAAARPEPIPVFAEMGSVNPVFVLPDALATRGEAIAAGLHQAVTTGAGQFCTCPGLMVALDGAPLHRATNTLTALFAATAPATMLHAGIRRAFVAGAQKLEEIAGVQTHRAAQSGEAAHTQAPAILFSTNAATFLENERLGEEVFGPSTVLVRCASRDELLQAARHIGGHLTATIHATEKDLAEYGELLPILENQVGRVILNGFPTGVEVCPSMQHGGPYPATTDSRFTAVGAKAIKRFARPICYQNFPQSALPLELQNHNTRHIWRLVNNEWSQADIPA